MKLRLVFFSVIFFFILLLFTEILLRTLLLFFGYPFFKPSDYIYKGFYSNLLEVSSKPIRNDDGVKDILILGGSVVSTPWSHMEDRLDTILKKHYRDRPAFAFYNVAGAGHTSIDNALKYRLLDKQRFDLVIYYEAINENRANNIAAGDFRADYSHIKWYNDIYLLRSHPEINFTVIPFLADKLIHALEDQIHHKVYISQDKVDPALAAYGADIKTAGTYSKSLKEIIRMAKSRNEKLMLMSYATYFPDHVKLTGEESDMKHFAGCNFASPVTIWGKPENVRKGVQVHNKILRKLVKDHQVLFLDMENQMPKDSALFCDVCHVSEPGGQRFAHEIVRFVVDKKVF